MLKKPFSNFVCIVLFVYITAANNHDLLALWEIFKNNYYDEDDENPYTILYFENTQEIYILKSAMIFPSKYFGKSMNFDFFF